VLIISMCRFFEPAPIMPTRIVSQENEFIQFGHRSVHVDNVVRLLDFLVDSTDFSEADYDLYHEALFNHFHHGIMPGFDRFPLPGGRQMYFLPALTVLFDNYIDPPAQIEGLRVEWMEEELSDTDSLTDDELEDLVGELIDPDNVIDQMLLDAVALEYRGDPVRDGQDDGQNTI